MREILFRGKRADSCSWVYGYTREIWASKQEECRYIICPSMSFDVNGWTDLEDTEVIPETVGQFTGLTDKNGVKIFEGDIVNLYGNISVCKFINGSFVFGGEFDFAFGSEVEVIGNIHDNSELLK